MVAGKRDHGAIVGTQMRRRKMHLCIELKLKLLAKAMVGAHAASNDKFLNASLSKCARHFDAKGIDNRLLKACGDVSSCLIIDR